MKNMASYETQRVAIPATYKAIKSLMDQEQIETKTDEEIEQIATCQFEPVQEQSGALTVHFNNEKPGLERQVAQDLKRLQTQLKLLHTDLVPSPVRLRVNHIEELINNLVTNFKRLLSAQTTELELYAHRVASAQLLIDEDE